MESFQIQIRGGVWEVKPASRLYLKEEMEVECFGYTDHDSHTIYIQEDISGYVLKSTVYHELCHAILSPVIGSHLHNTQQLIDEELACNLIGDGLVEIFTKSKLPQWLIE